MKEVWEQAFHVAGASDTTSPDKVMVVVPPPSQGTVMYENGTTLMAQNVRGVAKAPLKSW